MRLLRLLLLGVALCLAALGGFAFGTRRAGRPNQAVVAIVNDEKITRAELDRALRISTPAVLQGLVQQRLVFQEARRLGLTADESEPGQVTTDLAYQEVLQDEARFRSLVRKIILKDVPEGMKQELYDMFGAELTRYELSLILVASKAEARLIHEKTKKGERFEDLARACSMDEKTGQAGGQLGWLTPPDAQNLLGGNVGNLIRGFKENSVSAPIATPRGLALLKVGKIRRTYAELKPDIENLIVEGRRAALLDRLRKHAVIRAPLTRAQPAP